MELFRILQQKKEQLPNTIVPFSDILARLCFVLECTPGDIIKYNFLFYYNTILHTDFRIRDDGSSLCALLQSHMPYYSSSEFV